jgi:hypothetical protein
MFTAFTFKVLSLLFIFKPFLVFLKVFLVTAIMVFAL